MTIRDWAEGKSDRRKVDLAHLMYNSTVQLWFWPAICSSFTLTGAQFTRSEKRAMEDSDHTSLAQVCRDTERECKAPPHTHNMQRLDGGNSGKVRGEGGMREGGRE